MQYFQKKPTVRGEWMDYLVLVGIREEVAQPTAITLDLDHPHGPYNPVLCLQSKSGARSETSQAEFEVQSPLAFTSALEALIFVFHKLQRLSCADLERELLSIDREEKKLIIEIKNAAKNGNDKGARVLAQSLVRLRGQRTKLLASSAQLRGVRASIGVRILCVLHM